MAGRWLLPGYKTPLHREVPSQGGQSRLPLPGSGCSRWLVRRVQSVLASAERVNSTAVPSIPASIAACKGYVSAQAATSLSALSTAAIRSFCADEPPVADEYLRIDWAKIGCRDHHNAVRSKLVITDQGLPWVTVFVLRTEEGRIGLPNYFVRRAAVRGGTISLFSFGIIVLRPSFHASTAVRRRSAPSLPRAPAVRAPHRRSSMPPLSPPRRA